MRGTKFLKINKYLRVPFYGQNAQQNDFISAKVHLFNDW